MTPFRRFLKRYGLLPSSDPSAPLIDPKVEEVMNRTVVATQTLRRELRGQAGVDAMLHDLFGDRYIPPLGNMK